MNKFPKQADDSSFIPFRAGKWFIVIAVQAEGPGLGPYSLSGFYADWSAVSPMTLASKVGDKGSLEPAGGLS